MSTKNNLYKTSHFTVMSINYQKADTKTRGKFAFFPQHIPIFIQLLKEQKAGDALVLSTCNRTEIYTVAQNHMLVAQLYCDTIGVDFRDFVEFVVIKSGKEALEHIFRVAAGLESQILGDFEIISQIKSAHLSFKKQQKYSNLYLEKAVNYAIQISKRIKNETSISSGATSVSYAAVHYILNTQQNLPDKNILLLGTGEIGQNTIDNLLKHIREDHIKISNRTPEKSRELAEKFGVQHIDFFNYELELEKTDILIVATGANQPIITKDNFPQNRPMLVLDLSIPNNVDPSIKEKNPTVELINVDKLSELIENTLTERRKEIPKAEFIIGEMIKEFFEWEHKRKFAPNIRYFKSAIKQIEKNELHNIHKKYRYAKIEDMELSNKLVQKITNRFAKYIIDNPDKAEQVSQLMKLIFVIQPQEEFNEKH